MASGEGRGIDLRLGGPIDLVARAMERHDFGSCLHLLQDGLGYPEDVLGLLARFWERLLEDEALTTTVIEARDPEGWPLVAGFGASVFVTDDWMEQASHGDEPYLTARTVKQEIEGRSPILRPAQVAEANTRGLNVLILHYAETPGLAAPTRPALRYRMFQALIESHRGYRIEAVLQEFWDEIDPEFVTHGWGRLLTNYAGYFHSRGEPVPPEGKGPLLVGITRSEVEANPGAIAAPLFVHVPPRIGFTPAEQRLLRAALSGQTDIELTESLGLSISTVKSRWRNVYQRVAHQTPELLSDLPSMPSGAGRGKEKRRRLLDYLRRHPEELRPG